MEGGDSADQLRRLQEENARLKAYIAQISHRDANETSQHIPSAEEDVGLSGRAWDGAGHGLTAAEVARYSRQIVLPSFGIQGR